MKSTTRNATVGVGSKNGDGYSVFVLEIDVPEKINVSTEIHLEDYQLNKIENDILSPVQGILTNSGENVINPKNVVDRECAFSDEVHKIYRGNSSYNLKSTEYQKGITVDADRNSKTEKLVYYNKLLEFGGVEWDGKRPCCILLGGTVLCPSCHKASGL